MALQEISQGNPLGLPICKQCGRLMDITRVETDVSENGPELQMFECTACGSTLQRSVKTRGRQRGG
jgi:hypothetical protein